jgi:hypothetical protein
VCIYALFPESAGTFHASQDFHRLQDNIEYPARAEPEPWIDRANRQEQFSNAFLQAVAAVAGCAVCRPSPDNDSIDWTLSCRLPRRPKLDVQLKSTTFQNVADNDIYYQLKVKNYDDLIVDDVVAPRILVLVTVPRGIDDWLSLTAEQLLLRYAAYWKWLAGGPKTRNTKTVRIIIPQRNLFTPMVLRNLMTCINDGGPLQG